MFYMMNWWWKKVGVRVKFDSRNPPISLRHVNSLSMSNCNAFRNSLKKFQCWPHSQVTSRLMSIHIHWEQIKYSTKFGFMFYMMNWWWPWKNPFIPFWQNSKNTSPYLSLCAGISSSQLWANLFKSSQLLPFPKPRANLA